MEKLSSNLAQTIATSLDYDKNQEAVIAYGLTALLQMIVIACVVTTIGLIFGFTYESLIIFLGVGLLRKATGGAHSQTIHGCMITSCFHISLFSYLSQLITRLPCTQSILAMIYLLCFLWCYYIIYKKAPVDSPRKPITNPVKIKRLRKQSFLTLTIYCILFVFFCFAAKGSERFLSLANSICLLSVWQCFTLTALGHTVIHKIDALYSTNA